MPRRDASRRQPRLPPSAALANQKGACQGRPVRSGSKGAMVGRRHTEEPGPSPSLASSPLSGLQVAQTSATKTRRLESRTCHPVNLGPGSRQRTRLSSPRRRLSRPPFHVKRRTGRTTTVRRAEPDDQLPLVLCATSRAELTYLTPNTRSRVISPSSRQSGDYEVVALASRNR